MSEPKRYVEPRGVGPQVAGKLTHTLLQIAVVIAWTILGGILVAFAYAAVRTL